MILLIGEFLMRKNEQRRPKKIRGYKSRAGLKAAVIRDFPYAETAMIVRELKEKLVTLALDRRNPEVTATIKELNS